MVQAASARAYYSARQYPEAIDQAKVALELDSTYPRARFWVGMAQEQLGKPDEAIRELKATIAKGGPTSIYVGALGHVYATNGHRREALQILMISRAGPSRSTSRLWILRRSSWVWATKTPPSPCWNVRWTRTTVGWYFSPLTPDTIRCARILVSRECSDESGSPTA